MKPPNAIQRKKATQSESKRFVNDRNVLATTIFLHVAAIMQKNVEAIWHSSISYTTCRVYVLHIFYGTEKQVPKISQKAQQIQSSLLVYLQIH